MDTRWKVCMTAGSFLTTSVFFLFLKRRANFPNPSKHHWGYLRRWFMLFHTITTSILSTANLLTLENLDHPNTFQESTLICLMLGHFAFDFLYVCYLMPEWIILLHHFLIFVWFPFALINDAGGVTITIAVFVVDLSDNLLHIKSLMRYLNQSNTLIYFLAEFLFLFNYYASVFCIGPILTVRYFFMREHNEWIWSIGFFGIYLQKVYIAWGLRKVIMRRIQEYYNLKKKKEAIPMMNPIKVVFSQSNAN